MAQGTRQRLDDVIALLRRSFPVGMTTSEIADELRVSRQTAHHDIQRLKDEGIPIQDIGRGYTLNPKYARAITLTAAQAWMLYLPLRRMVRAQLHRNPLVRKLLRRVTELLRDEMSDQLVMDNVEPDKDADQVFQTLVDCWSECCLAEITYRKLNATRSTLLVVAPWWFEPAVWTDAFYLVCGVWRKGTFETLTLKTDRVQSARKLLEHYERPTVSALTGEIQQTWGIWLGEDQPARVRLRFEPQQLDRLRETRWHPSQKIAVDVDGSVIWEADVSEPQEMLPWIKSWGGGVQVLEPKELRETMIGEVKIMAEKYGWLVSTSSSKGSKPTLDDTFADFFGDSK